MYGSTFLYLPSELTAGQPKGAMRSEVHAIGFVETTFMEDSWGVTLHNSIPAKKKIFPIYIIGATMADLLKWTSA